MPRLILASSSPRRLALLQAAGLAFEQHSPRIDETPLPAETCKALVARLATAKARAVQAALQPRSGAPRSGTQALILAADTVVSLDGALMGKPKDRQEGARLLRALSGRTHEVLTGFALLGPDDSVCQVVATQVSFRPLTAKEIDAYWDTGEPQDKAGGYGIQGQGRGFVSRLEGSYTNVVGLPMEALGAQLRRQGLAVAEAACHA